ncbi:MAG: Hsp20/alpha crystallin family protein [Acidobacteria bacterium]|nr:Hsp20/alpha crystallin family protein [Acidobacteriota bacterium]
MNDFFSQTSPELAEDARRLLLEIDHGTPGASVAIGNCRPPLDILERPDALEIVMDVPGVPPDALRVAVRGNTLLVVGRKPSGPLEPNARFHLAERSYGRFARAVRLDGAFDGGHARAVIAGGQLRVTLPLLVDRRGRIFAIPVERG